MFNCGECGGEILRARKNSEGEILCRKCNHNRRNRAYSKSEKGKATSKRKKQTDWYKVSEVRYRQSAAFKMTQRRYRTSDRGREVLRSFYHERYWSDPAHYRKKALMRVHGIEDYRLVSACENCGTTVQLELDHKYPTSKGGTSEDRNLWTLCRSCNAFKGARLLTTGNAPALMVA